MCGERTLLPHMDHDHREQLDRIEAKLDVLILQGDINMSALDDSIAALTTQVTANTNAEAAAVQLVSGIPAMIATAVAAAVAAGASPAQLAALTTLQTTLRTSA